MANDLGSESLSKSFSNNENGIGLLVKSCGAGPLTGEAATCQQLSFLDTDAYKGMWPPGGQFAGVGINVNTQTDASSWPQQPRVL